MKNEKKIKLLSLKYRYLTLELEEVRTEFEACKNDFNKYLYSLQTQHDITIFNDPQKKCQLPPERQDEDIIPVDAKRDRKQDKIFKDLYKKISLQTHPDVTDGDEDMSILFQQATKAKNNDDLMSMLDICDGLDIDIPALSDEQIYILEKNIKRTEEKVRSIKKQDAWIWKHADENGKKKIEKNILKLFKKIR